MTATALEVRGLRVGFADRSAPGGSREVVHGLDLDLVPGRVLALVGESGSGKSVSATAVLGLLPPGARVGGSVRLTGAAGAPVDLLAADAATWRHVRGARIGAVFQEPVAAWNPVQRIGTQVAETVRAHHPHASDVDTRVRAALAAAGLDDPDRVAASFPHELSGGQLQRAMIAMATVLEPEVLLADEPTTALDVTVQAGVLDLLRALARDRGTAVLLITHDMGVVADLADDVVVLRDGEVVERGPVDTVLVRPTAPYTRELLAAVPSVTSVREGEAGTPEDPSADPTPAARITGLRVVYPGSRTGTGRRADVVAVDGIDLDLVAGRTVGVVGESGSGKSTLAACLTGLLRPTSGRVEVDGTDLASRRGRRLREVQRRAGIVFQDPGSSLNPRRTVAWSVAEPLGLAGRPRAGRRPRVLDLLDAVGLEPSLADRYPHQLSGGQRQRVAIARALALDPRLVVADEPTSALDVSVQARVLRLLADLQRDLGFACLFISHDLAVVAAVAHDVVVMRDGLIVERGPAADVLRHPTAAYTQALIAAAPVADPRVQRGRRARAATTPA